MSIGQIIKVNKSNYKVLLNDEILDAKLVGTKLKNLSNVKTGDYVEIIKREEKYFINEIKSRKNDFIRPSVANVDEVILINSIVNPKISFTYLNKLIAIFQYNNLKPLICFTKADLVVDDQVFNRIKLFKNYGYEIFIFGKNDENEINNLKSKIKNKFVALVGQSGVGKSTLINKMFSNSFLKTGEVSKIFKGKHTTTSTEIHILEKNYLIADTPGFSSLYISLVPKIDVASNFLNFENYFMFCKSKNCLHLNEPNCKIREMIKEGKIMLEDYNDYVEIISNYQHFYFMGGK